VIKPTISIIGITHHVNFAPPVAIKSVKFMATSIEIIEIMDIPMAVWNAALKDIWRKRINVSSKTDVIKPLIIAKVIITITGQAIPIN
jgi:hypothetical protein